MSQPDDKLVPFPKSGPVPQAGARPGKRPRDPRIDAFRGIALVMILIDHMPGNPFEALTTRNFGFSDAAEGFFIMSGIAAGIAYSGPMLRWLKGEDSLWSAVSPMWRRAWTLYLTQIFLTVTALALFAWAAEVFFRPEFREMHNLARIYEETGAALSGLAALTYQIGYVNILPTYIVLLLVGPLAVLGAIKAPRLTLALSLGLWFVAGWAKLNIPNHPGGGGWFFSPFTWQAVFVLGLAVGVRARQGERLVPVSRPLFAMAAGFLVLALAWREIPVFGAWMNNNMWMLGKLGLPDNLVTHNKPYLAAPRLLHAVALLYVLSCLPLVRRLSAHRWAEPLRLLGRQGLLVFAAGTILALAGQILMDVEPESAWLPWLLPPLAVALSWLIAWTKERQARPAARPGRAAAGLVGQGAGPMPAPAVQPAE